MQPTNLAVSVTESALAEQFLSYDLATWPMQQALSRNLWAGWQRAKREGISQNVFLTRVTEELKRRGSTKGRTPTSLYSYLYSGAALTDGFTPASLKEGEMIGKALDRLSLPPEIVRAHLEAGNLADVVDAHRTPTTTVRVTAETKDVLDDAAQRARATLNTEGLNDPEVRAILPKAWNNSSEQIKDFLLRLGNGDVDPTRTYIVEAEEARPGAPVKPAAPPVDYGSWSKLNAPCYVCQRTPAESGLPHHLHHVAVGEHEARPNDDVTPELLVAACPRCHIPQPFSATQTAHSRAYAFRRDPDALIGLLHYNARCWALYQQAIGAARPKGET